MFWAYLNSFYKNAVYGNHVKSNRDLDKAFEIYTADQTDPYGIINLMQADIGKFYPKVPADVSTLDSAQFIFINRFNLHST